MLFTSLVLSAFTLTSAHTVPPSYQRSAVPLDHVTIFTPPSNYTIPRTLYARTLQLKNSGTLLASWENYGPNNNTFPYFPIYQSTDGGKTWSERTRVYDQVNGWGLRYQPFLYELQKPFGKFKAGTIILAGSSIPDDLSQTQLELYASTDQARTFRFVSHIARGGVALPNNGETPVWEPFLMAYNNRLIYYYSDQRDPAHGQKLVHQTSTDLSHWTAPVDDVAYPTYDWRPGMTTVSRLPNGQYLLTYEFYGAVEAGFAVYYKLARDPTRFAAVTGRVLKAGDGSVPVGSPYNVWTPAGGPQGTVVVTCGSSEDVWLSRDLAKTWTRVPTNETTSYTRSLLVEQDQGTVLIAGGGELNGANNRVTASTFNVNKA